MSTYATNEYILLEYINASIFVNMHNKYKLIDYIFTCNGI